MYRNTNLVHLILLLHVSKMRIAIWMSAKTITVIHYLVSLYAVHYILFRIIM